MNLNMLIAPYLMSDIRTDFGKNNNIYTALYAIFSENNSRFQEEGGVREKNNDAIRLRMKSFSKKVQFSGLKNAIL